MLASKFEQRMKEDYKAFVDMLREKDRRKQWRLACHYENDSYA